MVYGLTHRRCTAFLVLCLFVLSSCLLCGCDPRYGQYPMDKADFWYSADPVMTLSYKQNADKTWTVIETLCWNDETMEISIGMRSDYYCVYPAGEILNHDERLFSGRWGYRNGNLVLSVKEDFIFDGKYSEITLIPSKTGDG